MSMREVDMIPYQQDGSAPLGNLKLTAQKEALSVMINR